MSSRGKKSPGRPRMAGPEEGYNLSYESDKSDESDSSDLSDHSTGTVSVQDLSRGELRVRTALPLCSGSRSR